MNKPLISVIIPVYNVEKYLSRCIDSVVNQTYRNLEIILVDDGSPDRCGEICDKYALLDNRISVIHKENGGQGSARNRGIDASRGDIIAFLDSDDWMKNDCLSTLFNAMLEYQLDIVSCNYACYDDEGVFLKFNEVSHENFVTSGIEAQKMIWYAECINLSPWGKLFKRDYWKDIRFKECRFYEDYATMHLVYLKASRFGYLKYDGINYTVRKGSDVRTFNDLKLLTLDIANDTIEYSRENCTDILSAAIAKAVSLHFHIFLNMPNEEKYYEWKKRIKKFIREYRFGVLRDKRANKKTKAGLLISFLGYRITRKIYVSIKEKNILF